MPAITALAFLALLMQGIVADEPTGKPTEMAKTLIAEMAAGRYEKAVEPFDATMKLMLSADKLRQVWEGLGQQYGSFQQTGETTTDKIDKYNVVYVTCEFQRGKIDAKIVFSSDNKVTGLFFVPAGRYQPPSYVDFSQFEEQKLRIGKGMWSLPGTLALPKGEGPFAAVILVHGSGPQDRDETIGPNKPFRDLAHGLASRGIAVLRYEKRTKEHQIMMALTAGNITVKEETIDDVVAAFKSLASQPKIDSRRIFVLGHSLGGMLIPRIGTAEGDIAGFISFAGSTRPLEDLILEQTKYLLSREGKMTAESQKQLEELEQQIARVKSPALSTDGSPKLPLGVPAKYWLDLRGYDPAKEVQALSRPLLVLQGERDYQVTMEDFSNWKKALESRKDVKLVSYPKLNHLFMEGVGKSVPAEYTTPGNVAKAVIDDIVRWIDEIKQ